MKIAPFEMELNGTWLLRDGQVIGDELCARIDGLVRSHLKEIARDPSGWEAVFRDPDDGRLWELTYPQGELQGGGPPQLRCIPAEEVVKKYGGIASSA